jgi:uncharacterized radical SAM protein YgiQ
MSKSRLDSGFLPSTRAEMTRLGWDRCDIVIVTGDAYVDHPSFGAALIGRLLESLGWRVGILPQPDREDAGAFLGLGVPRLFVGVTAGAMDSMVSNYTSLGRKRTDDDYSEGGRAGRRPDRALLAYCNRLRQVMPDTPLVLGGIEASLRRFSHYDFWSETVRKSVLLDTRASVLVYGMGERQIAEIARRMDSGESLDGIPGTAVWRGASGLNGLSSVPGARELPSHEEVCSSPEAFMEMTRAIESEANPWCGKPLFQRADSRGVLVNAPALPLETSELDSLYALPFTRRPHPRYEGEIPAWTMIRDSITAVRGCAGGCSFCALGLHQGKAVRSRSARSLAAEAGAIASGPGFRGTISDVGGPTANMHGLGCSSPEKEKGCRRPSCLFPSICPSFRTDSGTYLEALGSVAQVKGVKHVHVTSGIRLDLAVRDPRFIEALAARYTSGHLKVAPESFSDRVLRLMRKSSLQDYLEFCRLFGDASRRAGLEQYVLPYVIAAFPGSTRDDMRKVADVLREQKLRPRQVQVFLPVPLTMATAMYFTGLDPEGKPLGRVARRPSEKRAQLRELMYWR